MFIVHLPLCGTSTCNKELQGKWKVNAAVVERMAELAKTESEKSTTNMQELWEQGDRLVLTLRASRAT